ncbi:hypothetical protein C2S52_007713 [Perilla frutescens var. hirtella]|nr:hypothetical protein C2S52_007713 [Perilla frutescens var. hirtella]
MNDKQQSSWHGHGKPNSSTAVHSARMESSFGYAGCSGIGTQRSVHEVAESVLEAIHAGVGLDNTTDGLGEALPYSWL